MHTILHYKGRKGMGSLSYRKHYFFENQFWKVCQGCTTVDYGTFFVSCFENISWEL
jgi:hypothetical protein